MNSLRILYIGDRLGQVSMLASQMTKLGHYVGTAKDNSRDAMLSNGFNFDIVHLHHYTSHGDAGTPVLDLTQFRSNGSAIIHQLYDRSFMELETCFQPGVMHPSDLVLLSRGDTEQGLPNHSAHEWFTPGAVVVGSESFNSYSERIAATTNVAPQQVRILAFGEHSDDPHVVRVVNAAAEAQNARFKFHFTLCNPKEINYHDQLAEVILNHHLVIEHSDGTPFGALAIEALALGRCVMSGARAPAEPESVQNRTSPIIDLPIVDVQIETLGKKLQAFIREPRALRDLSNRSRDYIKRFHDSIEQARKLNSIHERIVGRSKKNPVTDHTGNQQHG